MLTRLGSSFRHPFPKLTPEEEEAKLKELEDFKMKFLLEWQSNDFVGLSRLLRFINCDSHFDFDGFLMPLFLNAIKEKKLIIWDNKITYIQNDRVVIKDKITSGDSIYTNAVVFKKDFITWQQQAKSVPIPETLRNIIEPDDTPTTQQLVDKKNTKKKSNFSGLEKINKRKADIQGMARVMATHFWQQDTSQTKISDMADKVYRFVSDYADVTDMPENIGAVADWIREVAPEYAIKGGRSKVIK